MSTNEDAPLGDYDFAALDDREFKEDGVREDIIAPILKALGYKAAGPNKVVRGLALEHPFASIGSRKKGTKIVPDYLLFVGERPMWVLDAKGPREALDDPGHIAQAYSYAIHRDVNVDIFALCNGHGLALFRVREMTRRPFLSVELKRLRDRWEDLRRELAPSNLGKRSPIGAAKAKYEALEADVSASILRGRKGQ